MEFRHRSVLLEETIENLRVKPEGIYVGRYAGRCRTRPGSLQKTICHGRFIGIDQDEDAIAAAEDRLREYKDRVTSYAATIAIWFLS